MHIYIHTYIYIYICIYIYIYIHICIHILCIFIYICVYTGNNIHAYRFEKKVGAGTYGKVYRGVHIATGFTVAIKTLDKVCCSVLQCVAVCCSVLQCVFAHSYWLYCCHQDAR